jgi:hypothetical protein
MPGMALLPWISLVFLVVAVVGSIAVAAVRALRVWRTFRRFSGATTAAIGVVLETAAEAERHALALTEGTERLSAALARLERSRARLAVVQGAAAHARASLLAFRGVVPRK